MNNNSKIGKIGEGIACEYLVKNQWKILCRNYKQGWDEIDVVAIAGDETLVFCEVKTLVKKTTLGDWGFLPEDNLTSAKFRKISRACQFFAGRNPKFIDPEKGWRIDLIAVDLGIDGKALDLRHYENIS